MKTKVKKPKVKTDFWENLGKLSLDIAKLTFASFVLGGILKGELPQHVILIVGGIIAFVCSFAGLFLTSKRKEIEDKE